MGLIFTHITYVGVMSVGWMRFAHLHFILSTWPDIIISNQVSIILVSLIFMLYN